jgi:acyl carrier protein phosphodiesterase
MNFLAHSHLSGENRNILFGNFIADSVKGKAMNDFPNNIKKGILLHRKIDSFTDKHEVFKSSVKLIRPAYGKFSGVVVDIYYDHFLAVNWKEYSNISLKSFARHVYLILGNNFSLLPARTKRMLPFLIAQNWLVGYSRFDGLKNVFAGMDRRTNNISGMKDAVIQLKINYDELGLQFKEFYPQLQHFAKEQLQELEI